VLKKLPVATRVKGYMDVSALCPMCQREEEIMNMCFLPALRPKKYRQS